MLHQCAELAYFNAYALCELRCEVGCKCDTRDVQNLTYTVNTRKERGKKIALLNNITGCFSPREMSALVRLHTAASTGAGSPHRPRMVSGRSNLAQHRMTA